MIDLEMIESYMAIFPVEVVHSLPPDVINYGIIKTVPCRQAANLLVFTISSGGVKIRFWQISIRLVPNRPDKSILIMIIPFMRFIIARSSLNAHNFQ